MFHGCIRYKRPERTRPHVDLTCGCVVTAALPDDVFTDAMVNVTANEQIDEHGDAEDRDGDVGCGKVRPGNTAVEAPESASPEEHENESLIGDVRRQGESEDREPEEENHIQDSPESEHDGAGHEQCQVLGPAFDHLCGGRVHARGECIGGVAEADGAVAALDVAGESDVF